MILRRLFPLALFALSAHAQTPTLRSTARLVVVDVVVTDANNHPVPNLPQSAFTLLEAKTPQRITTFQEHKALTPGQAAQFEPVPRLPPGIFTNFVPTPTNAALDILLLDALNTPIKDQLYVRTQLLDYLKHARPGTSVAIFGLSTQLRLLQGFTSDPEVLKQIVTRQLAGTSPLLDDPLTGNPTDMISDQLSSVAYISPAAVQADLQTFASMQAGVQQTLRVQGTLDAMNQLARYLADLPGRKNLLWFSGSFPLEVLPETAPGTADPFAAVGSSEAEYRETTNLLTRAQVAVYPIDARGLNTPPSIDASNGNTHYASRPGSMLQDNNKFNLQLTGEHDTMERMATDTGGRAFFNTNGLAEAVDKAIDAGSSFYTLAYTPQESSHNGEYRPIHITLAGQKYNLSYRRGYYAEDPDSRLSALSNPTSGLTADPGPMRRAMTHGAPGPTQIIFKARVLPTSTASESTLAQGNIAASPKSKAPYRRYAVDFAADAHTIHFTPSADGNLHAAVDFAALVYTPNGDPVTTLIRNLAANITPAQYAQLLRTGFPLHAEISVPDSDSRANLSLRLLVHDRLSNRIGATELPVAAVKNLPPAPVPAAAQPPPAPAAPAASPK